MLVHRLRCIMLTLGERLVCAEMPENRDDKASYNNRTVVSATHPNKKEVYVQILLW